MRAAFLFGILRSMRLPKILCIVVGDALARRGTHPSLDALFRSAGAPGEPPPLAHHSKWKEWIFRIGQDPSVDSLTVLGNLLEEFMDLPPDQDTPEYESWNEDKERIQAALAEVGLRYYRFGRLLPEGSVAPAVRESEVREAPRTRPKNVDEVLDIVVRGLPRAMHPLTHRRKGSQELSFNSEYDVQDLLHALLRPWVSDIRPEEFTPSYAGSSTRMDFLLPAYDLVVEVKIVRDRVHARKVGDELIIDIDHYRCHPKCERLWCVIYDPEKLIANPDGLKEDLEGSRMVKGQQVDVRIYVL